MVAITDLSQPISTVLREGTAEAHEGAEHSDGAAWLARGELDKEEYARFLMMLYHVYDTLERALTKHAANPVLEPTHNPSLLARAPPLGSDIAHLLNAPVDTWQSHPSHTAFLLARPEGFLAYTTRIQELADNDPARLLAHAYVRYLGDLSGGQVIRRRVVKSYGLDADSGAGVKFYEFSNMEGTRAATSADMKEVKDWFRKGMNLGVGDDEDLKAALLDEANKAFTLNLGLFSSLKAPSKPTTPVSNGNGTPEILGDSVSKEFPIEIVKHEEPERLVSLSSVLSFVVAVCLAHFLLVIGGFTGSSWLEKMAGWGLVYEG